MLTLSKDKTAFLLFEVGEGLYALSAEFVQEVLVSPPVVMLPNMPPEIRGMIERRGRFLMLVDSGIKLDLKLAKSGFDALMQLLHDREQDHRNWLKELEACVREHRPFNLARDPHKCKFGIWYDQYKNEEQTIQAACFRIALRKMDEPHKIIHASADEVLKKADSGNFEEALAILEERRNGELILLVKLFEEARRILKETRRELVIVVKQGAKQFAMCVDSVKALEHIPAANIEALPAALRGLGGMSCHVARRAGTGQTIMLLRPESLFPTQQNSFGSAA